MIVSANRIILGVSFYDVTFVIGCVIVEAITIDTISAFLLLIFRVILYCHFFLTKKKKKKEKGGLSYH